MDTRHFDTLTRALAARQSRRSAVRGLAGGLVAGVLGLSACQVAAAVDCPGRCSRLPPGATQDQCIAACTQVAQTRTTTNATVQQTKATAEADAAEVRATASAAANQARAAAKGSATCIATGAAGCTSAGDCCSATLCCNSTCQNGVACGTTEGTCDCPSGDCCRIGDACGAAVFGCCFPQDKLYFGEVCCFAHDLGGCQSGLEYDADVRCCPVGRMLFGDVCCPAGSLGARTFGDSCAQGVLTGPGCCLAGVSKLFGENCCQPNAVNACVSGADCQAGCCYGADCTQS